jgi:hypothetical protein
VGIDSSLPFFFPDTIDWDESTLIIMGQGILDGYLPYDRSAGVLETPTWRGIQRLGDLRNLCDHNKNKEPTDTDVLELIDGVEKITKTLF